MFADAEFVDVVDDVASEKISPDDESEYRCDRLACTEVLGAWLAPVCSQCRREATRRPDSSACATGTSINACAIRSMFGRSRALASLIQASTVAGETFSANNWAMSCGLRPSGSNWPSLRCTASARTFGPDCMTSVTPSRNCLWCCCPQEQRNCRVRCLVTW